MFSTLRNRFGIPGVISVIALVFAMFGGAYAASNSSGGGKATASAKAKKGPRGPKGATGPAGPAGPVGANGKDGANGTNGPNGAPGGAGPSGKSVVVGNTAPTCIEGGITVEVEGSGVKKPVCNGEAGTPGNQGEKGDPWTPNNTLPVGATETGTYVFSGEGLKKLTPGETDYEPILPGLAIAPISFTISLATPIGEEKAIFVPKSGPNPDSEHCPGSGAEPKAASGYLCVYEVERSGALEPLGITELGLEAFGSAKSGALVVYEAGTSTAPRLVTGSWAVTG
jgi:hypothetical protein